MHRAVRKGSPTSRGRGSPPRPWPPERICSFPLSVDDTSHPRFRLAAMIRPDARNAGTLQRDHTARHYAPRAGNEEVSPSRYLQTRSADPAVRRRDGRGASYRESVRIRRYGVPEMASNWHGSTRINRDPAARAQPPFPQLRFAKLPILDPEDLCKGAQTWASCAHVVAAGRRTHSLRTIAVSKY